MRLFGIYEAPLATPARDVGVLLCNPFGHEAVRAHRAFRQLALLLARARFHVLRFDYSGTGDSAGESNAVTMRAWCEDIGTASDELRDTTGVAKVAWVGLRLGGTLAALAAQERRDVDRLVMWDPILRGDAYLVELHRLHSEFMRGEYLDWKPKSSGPHDMIEALGFPLAEPLKREIAAIDLVGACKLRAKRSAFIISDETDDHRVLRERLRAADERLPPNITYENVPPSAWNSDAAMNSSLVPIDALRAIVDYLREGRP
jgi:pimeloyl-ACP methyl ester carboxylesterase